VSRRRSVSLCRLYGRRRGRCLLRKERPELASRDVTGWLWRSAKRSHQNGALGQAPAWGSVSSVNDARDMQKTASVGRRRFTDPATRDPVPLMLWGEKLWRRTPLQTHRRRRRNRQRSPFPPHLLASGLIRDHGRREDTHQAFCRRCEPNMRAGPAPQTPSKLNRPRRIESSSATSPRGTRSTCLYSPC